MPDVQFQRIAKFLFTGGCGTAIDFILYLCGIRIFPTYIAKALSMSCAIVWSFFMDKRWVFSSKDKLDVKLVTRYLMAQGTNLLTNVSTNQVMLYVTGNILLSFVVATACGAFVNYNMQRLFVFKQQHVKP